MNALDSPLEALALNYFSYGLLTAVNSLWAWAAVITAAVSFWRIRVLSEPRRIPAVQEIIAVKAAPVSSTPVEAKHFTSSVSDATSYMGGLERVKFTMYYSEDDVTSDGESDGNGEVEAVREELGWVCDEWERMMALRKGDMGWYRCQDLTALNGNVVRLWDTNVL